MATNIKPWKPEEDSDTAKLGEKANTYIDTTYTDPTSVSKLYEEATNYKNNNNPGEWIGGTYGDVYKNAANAYNNRKAFSYDLNGDALYQQYKDKYINQGRLAMADTIGQASAMTGGYGSSYATTAGSQAYQSHLQNLNDIVPQLYEMAYNRYTQEGQDLLNKFNMASQMYATEYGEHMDKTNLYNTTLDRLYNRADTERGFEFGKWDADRNYYTTAYNNAYTRDFGTYQQAVNEEIQRAQLKVSQDQLALQEAAATASKEEGLTFDQMETLKEYQSNKDWKTIDTFIMSLPVSDETKKRLAGYWLPDYYLVPSIEPPSKSPLTGNSPKIEHTIK